MHPIRLFSTPEVRPVAVEAANEALKEVVNELGQTALISYFGNWRAPEWRGQRGELIPYRSIDWYMSNAWVPERQQLNASIPLGRLEKEPEQNVNPHYDVLLVGRDLWWGQPDNRFIIGVASGIGRSTLVSTARFENDRSNMYPELIKQETAHEFGHLLRMARLRKHNTVMSLGRHCANYGCVMRQGLNVPRDWQIMATERLTNDGRYFCDDCRYDALNNDMI